MFDRGSHGTSDRLRVGDVGFDTQPGVTLTSRDHLSGTIDADHGSATLQKFLGAGPPNTRCGTCHHGHRPSQVGGRSPTAKLGLLQVPVLNVEQFMGW